ncbi:MAG: UDP-N-acetylmuramoyl-tripeptide--D-alanyl-D-alanine ligase, partial [Nitrospirae bacterium]|nr:UDP-N-acetylmuramoyl-tripeptide--D-alanyl-D-alanine ligase [Nitrospirota bacterium]
MVLTTEEIIRATGGNLISEKRNSFSGVSIDSRTVKEGEIFFALRGPRFDGHDFIKDAVFRGAEGVVIKEKCVAGSSEFGVTIIVVHDALKALQDLAHSLRVNRNIPVVAVTGSNGKTTTKEMIYKILSARFRVLKNDGNLNNHIGVPLSFMRLSPDDEMAVLEFGMNAPGEIRRLCEIAVPTCGVITNIGHAHIGQFGSLESVRNAKLELLDGLQVVVLNA